MLNAFKQEIASIQNRDPAARGWFEIVTTMPGFHAVLWHRLNHWLWCKGLCWLARFLSNVPRWYTGIEIHPGAIIGQRCFIDHGSGVVIGETAEIGDDCTLYHGVTLGGTSWQPGKRHPTLENGVVVGAGAKILGPVVIGTGARVGSNAVVVKAVPAQETVVGIPARIVKRRDDMNTARQHQMAQKMGFDAYGASKDMTDPVANAMHKMLDHIQAMDEQVMRLEAEIERLGGHPKHVSLPPLDDCELLDETARHAAVETDSAAKNT